ncbi:hypothetical protein [Phytoactinopolyspora halotolerans]|uniref:Uncharacterized protein n=1 Tax=Phytoactinopolyspora halotolerans TaxID=1981512 RepID=A0A6L9S8Y4_9ACTN|nr:hypothetical protein [Phytoactinopolyspora halotolerans]NEE01052.1 hypothetical protein [Phytoactinopolyspora halotolerans]
MNPERRLTWIALALGLLGAGLLIPFDSAATRVAGVVAIFAFIGLGVFAIASPGQLADDGAEDDQDPD